MTLRKEDNGNDEEILHHSLWRTCCGRGYGPVIRTDNIKNE